MALFKVPGWEIPTAPVSAPNKRKRPTHREHEPDEAEMLRSATANMEKLMATLGDGPNTSALSSVAEIATKSKRQKKQHDKPAASTAPAQKKTSNQAKSKATPEATKSKRAPSPVQLASSSTNPTKSQGKKKDKQTAKKDAPSQSVAENVLAKEKAEPTPGMTAMQAKMKQSLDGARFRWINEELYKSDSVHAHNMMREDPKVFEEYHTGFRRQVQSWPTNPVSLYISELSSYPPRTVIADLGCGDAALARALVPKGKSVFSFDLVSDGTYVIEADTCKYLPLPGSEGTESFPDGEGQVVDVVVCALSLMGTNWPTTIREAWRVMKAGGELKIAEVASRFTDVEKFISIISQLGFKLQSKDVSNTHFTLFEFKKQARKPLSAKTMDKLLGQGDILKPCEYKRR